MSLKETEKQLMEAGEKLLEPPSSVEELLTLLDLAENALGKVEQSPGKSMHDALSSLRKALVSDELLGHLDADVKASVASCVSEVTRITAPDAPYDDEKMKRVFQLIVSSFENLSDMSSRSYKKRAVILETLAKVRSCVIMLDLECDDLITDMFQIFLRTIRDYHPGTIYTSMETIMNLVLEESEEISTDLLTTLLSSVKKENEEVSSIARRLGESILGTSAVKLKPYLTQAIKYSGISLDNYSKIVTSVCEGTVEEDASNALIQQLSDGCKAAAVSIEVTQEGDGCKAAAASSEATQEGDGSKAATASSKETLVDEKDTKRDSSGEKPAPKLSLKITMSNGTNLTSKEKTAGKVETSQKVETSDNDNKSTNDEVILKPESHASGVEKSTVSAPKSRKTSKNRRKKASSSKISESSEPSHVDGEKDSKMLLDNLDSHEKDITSSPNKDVSPQVKNVESDKEIADIETLNDAKTASPSPSAGKASESLPKRDGDWQEKECATQGDVSSPERVTEKESERAADSGEASAESPVRKVDQESPLKDETSIEVGSSKHEESGSSDSEDTPAKKPSKKSNLSDNDDDDDDDDSPLKRIEDSVKRARTKARPGKGAPKSSTKNDVKVMSSHNKTAKSSKVEENVGEILSKRKRSLGKGETSEPLKHGKNSPLKYGKNLIRSKVKVWWPIDHEFYKGVIVSYDSDKRKHLVVYDDGDEELLNLRKEKWRLIGDGYDSATEEDDAGPASTDASSEIKPKSKKAKRSATSSVKQQDKDDVSPKRLSASSSKSKGKSSKPDKKSASKSGAISEDESGSKSKAHSQSGSKSKAHSQKLSGKPINDASKSSGKAKDLDNAALKSKSKQDTSAGKSKEDTPKVAVKGKSQGTGSKSNANGSGKGKSSLSKGKGSHDQEKRSESPEVPESTKRKLSDLSSDQGSLAKIAKKKRSVKG